MRVFGEGFVLEMVLRFMTLPPEPSKASTASCVARIAPRTVELAMKILFGHCFEGREAVDAGIVHKDAGSSEPLPGLREQTLHVRALGDIGLDGDSLAPGFDDIADDPIGVAPVRGVIDCNRSPCCGEGARDGRADPLRGSGNDRDFSGQLAHDRAPCSHQFGLPFDG